MIGVLGVGCVLPLGDDPAEVRRRLLAGEHAIGPIEGLRHLPDPRGGLVSLQHPGSFLKRKKDFRLLPRAAVLALPAAGRALTGFVDDPEDLGLFVGVGREPPDEGEAEPSLCALANEGRLDLSQMPQAQALYPPLLPLRTLPNMILAHVSIQYGVRGENGTFAGGAEAGQQALIEGIRAVEEGRCRFALVGAAHSNTDAASTRDRWRQGIHDPPGEGAIFALIGEGGRPLNGLDPALLRMGCGDMGPVEGLAAVL